MVAAPAESGLMEPKLRLTVPTARDMEDLGGRLAAACPPGCKIFLRGPLGAGKTTLVRGFLRALGFAGAVKSPTYTLVEPYVLAQHTVYHFDFYRIVSPAELEGIGLRDYLDQAAICLIEWPENAGHLCSHGDLHIVISLCEAGRDVELEGFSPAGQELMASEAHHIKNKKDDVKREA